MSPHFKHFEAHLHRYGTVQHHNGRTECDLSNRTAIRKVISDTAKPFLKEGFTKGIKVVLSDVVAHVNQGFVGLGGIHAVVVALLPDVEVEIFFGHLKI